MISGQKRELVRVEPEAFLVEFMRRRRDRRDGRGEVGIIPEFARIAHGLHSFHEQTVSIHGKVVYSRFCWTVMYIRRSGYGRVHEQHRDTGCGLEWAGQR